MKQSPLSAILQEPEEPKSQINATEYEWQQLHSAREIREFHDVRTKVESVTITGTASNTMRGVLGYGDRYIGTEEAWRYSDGCVLLAATISEWQGTFASHDQINVRYFALTPKTKHQTAQRTRKEK